MNNEVEQVLKEFKELGWKYIDYRIVDELRLFTFFKMGKKINIWFDRSYSIPDDYDITLQEHQLLTKLFEALGWYDEKQIYRRRNIR